MKILVIRFLAIGDVVFTSVLCNSLKKSYPDSQVDYLVHEPSASLFENHPYIDNVISLTMSERKNLYKYFKKVYDVTRNNYDIIIDATSTGKSGMFCFFSRQAKYKIGRYKGEKRGVFYTHKIKHGPEVKDKINQRLDMLAPLSENGFDIKPDHEMIIHITDMEKQAMKNRMLEEGIDFNSPILIFSVSSKVSFKKWRLDYMVTLIKHCLNNLNAQVIFYYWGDAEYADVNNIHNEELDNHKSVFSSIKLLSSRDLAAIMTNCDMFVGNEGGPRHIAQAVKLPIVAICSPSADKEIWLPNASDRYVGIDWKDIPENLQENPSKKFKNGDSVYNTLYDSITPAHVIPLVDQVFNLHVKTGATHARSQMTA